MLYNVPELSNQELQHLFVEQSKLFMSGLDKNMPFSELKAIRVLLREITEELDKRRKDGRLKDC
jgi:hypothetical protein